MLPLLSFSYSKILIYLSGTVAKDYCYYNFEINKNNPLLTNTIYKMSFNFLTDKIEIFFNDQLLSTCREMENNPNIVNCELASGEGAYDNLDNFSYSCSTPSGNGFQYEAKPLNKLPIYVGYDYDYGSSHPIDGGRVRNINIYTLN